MEPTAITIDTRLNRNGEILYAQVGTEDAVMLSVSAGRYFGVNAVGRRVWELLDRPRTVSEICAALCEEFEIDAPTCRAQVLEFLNSLASHGIVHESPA